MWEGDSEEATCEHDSEIESKVFLKVGSSCTGASEGRSSASTPYVSTGLGARAPFHIDQKL